MMENSLTTPVIALPVIIDAAGTAANTTEAHTVKSIVVHPATADAQLKVTIGGVDVTFPVGIGWDLPVAAGKYGTRFVVTALVGQFVVSKLL